MLLSKRLKKRPDNKPLTNRPSLLLSKKLKKRLSKRLSKRLNRRPS